MLDPRANRNLIWAECLDCLERLWILRMVQQKEGYLCVSCHEKRGRSQKQKSQLVRYQMEAKPNQCN